MHANPSFLSARRSASLLALCCCVAGVTTCPSAWAYKVERVCEMTEPTAKKPATKVCKTLLVKTDADGKPVQKEKKEEKPAAGHH